MKKWDKTIIKVLFQVIKLTIEYNASNRALILLSEGVYINQQEEIPV